MRYRKRNKRGTSSVFLAIVLSAVILVQCTYFSLVCDLNRKMTICRAVSSQVDSFLADYDRTLFSVYGIYAFDINGIDCDIFDSVMEANGMINGDTLAVSGVYTFDTDDLARAVAVYYSYRMPGVAFTSFMNCFSGITECLELDDLAKALRDFGRSDAASFMIDFVEKSDRIREALESVMSQFDISEVSEKIESFGELMEELDDMDSDGLDPEGGIGSHGLSVASEAISRVIGVFSAGSSFIEDVAFHPFAVHYAAYNFDCSVGPHTSINGTDLGMIHDGVYPDVEYILTGQTGNVSQYEVNLLVYGLLIGKNVVEVLADPEKREIVEGVAEVLEALVLVLTVGSCQLPSEVYVFLVAYLYSKVTALSDYGKIMRGDKIALISSGETEIVQVGYREILYFYLNFIPDNTLLERMHTVIGRDFEGYVCGITLETTYKGEIISFERGYAMYE